MNPLIFEEAPVDFVPSILSDMDLQKNLRFVADRDRDLLDRFMPVKLDGGGITLMHETNHPTYPRDGA